MAGVTDGTDRSDGRDGGRPWVLAVDPRPEPPILAVGDPDGARLLAGATPADAPLAVVVLHPAGWDAARAGAAMAGVAARLGRPGWPPPVPLAAPEAAAWRALVVGLLPPRARVVVLDTATPEAAVVDRDGEVLVSPSAAVGGDALARARPGDLPGHLVALARQALDAAPAGPPFAGVLLAGSLPVVAHGQEELPALVARVTGRPPLLAGDPATTAVLGAAALGYAAATSATASTPQARPEPPAPRTGAPELPAGRRRFPWLLAGLGLLVALMIAGGLVFGQARRAPSPYTYTCDGGVVVAYSAECDRLGPSTGP
jgi:hypothetical protein